MKESSKCFLEDSDPIVSDEKFAELVHQATLALEEIERHLPSGKN
jgi:hypothetical protein